MLLVQVHVLSASRAGPKDLLEFCVLLFGMNTVLIPRILSSLPETRCSFTTVRKPQLHTSLFAWLSTLLFSSVLTSSPYYLPVLSGALLFVPESSPQIPMSLLRPETLASSSSLSYFFLPCVQVIITAPSPPSALLEVCRPFSLSPLGLSQNPQADTLPSPRGTPPAPW